MKLSVGVLLIIIIFIGLFYFYSVFAADKKNYSFYQESEILLFLEADKITSEKNAFSLLSPNNL